MQNEFVHKKARTAQDRHPGRSIFCEARDTEPTKVSAVDDIPRLELTDTLTNVGTTPWRIQAGTMTFQILRAGCELTVRQLIEGLL
jgi:hypothetical protein